MLLFIEYLFQPLYVGILIFVIVLLILPIIMPHSEKKVLDDVQRQILTKELGVKFARLSDGYTSYQTLGKKENPPVLLIHGFGAASFVWVFLSKALLARKFFVITYDVFGRGYSERIGSKYDARLFRRQIFDLLNFLNIKKKIHIIGTSMGGAIAADFVAHYPDKINKVVFAAPAGFSMRLPLVAYLLKPRFIGEYLSRNFAELFFYRGSKESFYDISFVDDYHTNFLKQVEFKGFKAALLSTLRHFPLQNTHKEFESIGRTRHPVLLLWGDKDKIVPFGNHELVKQAIPQLEFIPLANVGHIPHVEAGPRVGAMIADFLKH